MPVDQGLSIVLFSSVWLDGKTLRGTQENLQVTIEDGGLATVRNSVINSPSHFRGNGNIGSDPEFVNLALGDSQIKPTSPCLDRGNNW